VSISDSGYEPGDINAVEDPRGDTYEDSQYEPGDINAVHDDGGDELDDSLGNETSGGLPVGVLSYIARSLSNEPEAVVVQAEERSGSVRLRLHVAPDDMGRVIGRRGRTAQAIRTLVGAAGARDGIQTNVDIVDA
jgi:uncharacterized protein